MMSLQFRNLALAGLVAMASIPASAITYVLNNGGSLFPTPGNYGTVELNQVGSDVTFKVELAAGLNFVTTGNQNSHSTFTFNATGVAAGDIQAIADATPVAGGYGVWTPAGNSPFGSFTWGIHCISCGNGAGGQQADPLTFKVANATISDFQSLSSGGTAAYFAADVIGQGNTGAVGVTDGPVPGIPEPETYALMLAGLGAIGFMARRRRQA
jgi:hypothetical protein